MIFDIHPDEKTPHLHIDYVSIGFDNKRGVKVQNGHNQALREMGYKGADGFVRHRNKEIELFTKICQSRGFNILPPKSSKGSLAVEKFKEERDKLNAERQKLDEDKRNFKRIVDEKIYEILDEIDDIYEKDKKKEIYTENREDFLLDLDEGENEISEKTVTNTVNVRSEDRQTVEKITADVERQKAENQDRMAVLENFVDRTQPPPQSETPTVDTLQVETSPTVSSDSDDSQEFEPLRGAKPVVVEDEDEKESTQTIMDYSVPSDTNTLIIPTIPPDGENEIDFDDDEDNFNI